MFNFFRLSKNLFDFLLIILILKKSFTSGKTYFLLKWLFYNLLDIFSWTIVTKPIIIKILPIANEYSNAGYTK